MNRSDFEKRRFLVEPFGEIIDRNNIVNLSDIGSDCLMTIEYSMDIKTRQINFWIISVEQTISKNDKQLGNFSTRIQPSTYLSNTKSIDEIVRFKTHI